MSLTPDFTPLMHSRHNCNILDNFKTQRWRKRQGRVREREIINFWNGHRFSCPTICSAILAASFFQLEACFTSPNSVILTDKILSPPIKFFSFIIFTFTYMCINCLGHLPTKPPPRFRAPPSNFQSNFPNLLTTHSQLIPCCLHLPHTHFGPSPNSVFISHHKHFLWLSFMLAVPFWCYL
jgi:hypothetical protein